MNDKRRILRNSKSLLSKTLRQFAVCTAVCFVLTAPLFYLLTKNFYAEDMLDIIEAVERGQAIPSTDLQQDIIAGMMLQFLLIFAAICLSMFVTMRFATRKLWQPFDDTLLKTEHFNLAESRVPSFLNTDIREFERLNASLERLMSKDKETYRIQKEFTENASHELQTPLAIIRSKLDLLMQENLTEQQMLLVSELYALTIRMGHLNRNLLMLAKIDNAQFSEMENVDIATILSEELPLIDAIKDGTSLRVEDHRTDHGTCLRANRVLTECMLKNLIVNAIRHSAPGGEVTVGLGDSLLTVANTSANGIALESSTLFLRFHTSNDRQKGNGLGLAIVKAICDLHGWTVDYNFVGGMHRFTVNFRTATESKPK